VVVMFGGELGPDAQTIVAQLPTTFAADGRRVLLHPLPLYNNSVGAHDMGMDGAIGPKELLGLVGQEIRALYIAGSFLSEQLDSPDTLSKLDFLVVQELFETATTEFADVVLPASSYAEQDGSFTNNDGFVQRVRQSIAPLHQSKPDWLITAQLASELGMDFGYQGAASAVFREIGERVPAYSGMRYPLLKDETQPVQVKHPIAESSDVSNAVEALLNRVGNLPDSGEKNQEMGRVGHELFKIGTLTDKVPQFHLLASGNPRPDTTRISPLYQITVDAKREEIAAAGD
jgi:NADH-quinone oxidoreductase subunit G